MYYQAIVQCRQAMKNVEAWLNKAEEHAAAKNFDVGVLMTGRLAPNPQLRGGFGNPETGCRQQNDPRPFRQFLRR